MRPKVSGPTGPWPCPACTTLPARACLQPRGCGPCICPHACPGAAGTGISDRPHTAPEFLQLSEARTWAWDRGCSGTPQALFPGPALPGSRGAWSDPAHSCGCLCRGEPGGRGCLRAGEKPGTCRWLTLSRAPPRPVRLLRLGPRRSSCICAGREEKDQAVMWTLLLPGPRSRADADKIQEKKQQKLASLIFSPSSRRISLSEGKTTNSSRPLSLHPPTPKLGALKEGVGGGASLSLGPLACGGLITPISG